MENEFTTYGHVDGKGKLSIYNQKGFIKKIHDYFKNSSIEILFKNRFYKFSDKARSYYFAVIVKEIQKGWLATGVIKSLKDIDLEMRDKFLFYEELNEETGMYEKYLHTLKKGDTAVSKKMMREYCDMCIIWSVQCLGWQIPYPSEVFDNKINEKNGNLEENRTF
jgi:hypothetical protein